MTAAEALLDNLRTAGITFQLDDAGHVLASPDAQLLPPWRQAIARHQAALAELLRREGPRRRGRPPPVAGHVAGHVGWARTGSGPWQTVCRQESADQCWGALLAIPLPGPLVERMVLPEGRAP
jgi:hypothetical protein